MSQPLFNLVQGERLGHSRATGELVCLEVRGERVTPPRFVQLIAPPGCHAPKPILSDFLLLIHAPKHTANDARWYAGGMAGAAQRRYYSTLRECIDCGRSFRMNNLKCESCRAVDRECTTCGKSFRGLRTKCPQCRIPSRTCLGCGRAYRSNTTYCAACRAVDRECVTCGKQITSHNRECQSCRVARHARDDWSAMVRQYNNTRRARKLAAEVSGPLPFAVYLDVIASGPCVYCGASAATVDHIRPLARGGHEIPENLVPACRSCNSSKSDRLLTEWRPDRAAHGVAASPLVHAEYERQLTDAEVAQKADAPECVRAVVGSRSRPGRARAVAIMKRNPGLSDAEVMKRAKVSESTVTRARKELPGVTS